MNPDQIKQAIRVALAADRPIMLWGPPGGGKTQVGRQVAAEPAIDSPLYFLPTGMMESVDFRGIPSLLDGRTTWNPPDFLPSERCILFADELPNADKGVQTPLLELCGPPGPDGRRHCGDYTAPEGLRIIAAGNRIEDRAGAGRMISSLMDRFVHVDFEVDPIQWVGWGIDNGIRTEVLAFIRFRPELLSEFDPRERVSPTPRSWQAVSDLIPHIAEPEIEYGVFSGTVGEGAAAEFMAFLKIARELPDPDAVLMDPAGAIIPTEPASLYALCGALAYRASEHNAGPLVAYADRLKSQDQGEFGVLLVTDAVRRDKDVTQTRAYIKWAAENTDVLI